jgi:two-component system, OmpR family, response regulator VicR
MTVIMIVDDDKDIRNSLKSLLEGNGFNVIIAENTDECLSKIEYENPDLIILDLLMEGKPVNELIEKYPYKKFIIVSAYISEKLEKSKLDKKLIKSLKSPNVVGRVSKPFNNDKLLELIKEKLN